jgi:hypothetical protein
MLGRRRIDTPAHIRSSLADAAFAVEERVVWGGADLLRGLADAVKWPFERIVWAIEQSVVWPLEERTEGRNVPVRAFGLAALALLAVGAGVLGLSLASSGGGGSTTARKAAAPPSAPLIRQAPTAEPPAAPILHGAKPDFTVETEGAKSGGGAASSSESAAGVNSTAEVATSRAGATETSGEAAVDSPGPTALEVARRFAGAFVLYEIGDESKEIRSVFRETATPQVIHSLVQRPPRQPANGDVPKAKVLNVVPGPHQGDTYTLSVSLLRVGVTSELRLDVRKDPKTDEWLVAGGLG